MASPYFYQKFINRKGMAVPLLAVAAGVSALSSILGGISGNRRRREAERQLAERQRGLDEWYAAEMNRNYLDRDDSRAALARIRDYNAEALDALNTNAIRTGATDEAKIAAASRLNRNYATAVTQIAGLGEQHKERVGQEYRARLAGLDNARYSATLAGVDGVQNMVSGLGSALGSLGMIYGMGQPAASTGGQVVKQDFGNVLPEGMRLRSSEPALPRLSLAGIRSYGQA